MRGVAYFSAEISLNETSGGSTVTFNLPSAQEIRGTFLLADQMNISQCSFMHITSLGADLDYLMDLDFLHLSYEPLSLDEMKEKENQDFERMMRMRDIGERFEPEEIEYRDSRWNDIKGGSLSEMMRLARLTSFEKLHVSKPEYWSLCSTGDVSLHTSKEQADWHAAGISLMRAVPVPDKDVSLEEIRVFKEKRKDELIHLWHSLDEARFNILKSPLPGAALQKELEDLQLALLNVQKVSKEWKVPKRLVDIHAAINFPISTAVTTALASQGIINHQLIVGGAVVDILLSAKKGMNNFQKQHKPFEYVARYHADLFNRH